MPKTLHQQHGLVSAKRERKPLRVTVRGIPKSHAETVAMSADGALGTLNRYATHHKQRAHELSNDAHLHALRAAAFEDAIADFQAKRKPLCFEPIAWTKELEQAGVSEAYHERRKERLLSRTRTALCIMERGIVEMRTWTKGKGVERPARRHPVRPLHRLTAGHRPTTRPPCTV
jgi:hypothetical protein